MGKTKNKRHKVKKPNPTGLPSVREIEKEEEVFGASEDGIRGGPDVPNMQSIIDKLQGVSVEDKECACCNITALIENPDSIPLLIDHDIIKMMAPLLTDPSFVVRHAAAGALRNLSATGRHEVCDLMVEEDVMTPLVALLKQYQGNWTPAKKIANKVDTKSEILLEAIHLLWNLCENNSTAIAIFNQEELLSIVFQFLNRSVYGNNLAVAAANCLHTVSEDNSEAIEFLSQPSYSEQVEYLINQPEKDCDATLLSILCAGIYLNIKNGKLTNSSSRMVSSIMEILSRALDLNVESPSEVLAKQIYSLKGKGSSLDQENVETETDKMNGLSADIKNQIAAQLVALEILTNICCNDDGPDDWDDLDSSDVSDEMYMSMDCGDSLPEKFPLVVASEIHEAINSHNLLHSVTNKIAAVQEDIVAILYADLKIGRAILKRFTTLHCRALLCLHNLISCLDIEELGGPPHLHSMWLHLAQLAFKHTYVCPLNKENSVYCNQPEHIEYLEAVTSAMRAVLHKFVQISALPLEQLSPSDIQMLCELAEVCLETNIRNNIINIVGTLGNALTKSTNITAAGPVIKNIGMFFLELCSKDTDLIVMAEALDAIFDVFGEDCTDLVAQEINLVERLKQILPSLKSKIGGQKKALGWHYPVVMTAKTNLSRFIKYKAEQRQTNGHH